MLLAVCLLAGQIMHLHAGTMTYDFSSVAHWVTESDGSTHPETGTSALITKIYYASTNDCFIGKNDVYFSDGYLMLKEGASLKIPCRDGWTINKVVLHAHKGGSTSVKVNILTAHDGYSASVDGSQEWKVTDKEYEYEIKEAYSQSPLFVKVTNKSNARITSVTIEYTSENDSDDPTNESSVSAPIFSPGASSFSSESLTVTIDAAEGCEVYYTTDGTDPSYIAPEDYVGKKGREAVIYALDSKVTLKAIAVNPTTGQCSNVSSATYTYVPVENDGSKSKPYTVAELRTMSYSTTKQDKWVRGTICGAVDGSGNLVTSNITIESNIALGDENAFIAVRLLSGASIRNEVNLKSHPYMLGKELLVKGDLESYLIQAVGVTGASEYEVFYDVPINSYGYATLYLDMPVALPSGAMAYYCTAEDDKVQLLPIERVIPDSVGVVLEYLPNETCRLIHTTEVNAIEDSIRKTNQLVGFTTETLVEADGYAYYALNVKDNVLGFYIPQTAVDAEDAASGFTAKANKAYLSVPAAQKAQAYVIRRLGGETAVLPVSFHVDDRIYDLQGRVVTCPSSGIYIRAGKKVVIK